VALRPFPLDGALLMFDRDTGTNVLFEGEETAALRCPAPKRLSRLCAKRALPSIYREMTVERVSWTSRSVLNVAGIRFMEFEYAVAEEYACVPSTLYFLARGRFLAELLASPTIFRTDHFRERYEPGARANIAALLRSPRYRAHRWFGWLYRYLV
jgi:hypothetical protein